MIEYDSHKNIPDSEYSDGVHIFRVNELVPGTGDPKERGIGYWRGDPNYQWNATDKRHEFKVIPVNYSGTLIDFEVEILSAICSGLKQNMNALVMLLQADDSDPQKIYWENKQCALYDNAWLYIDGVEYPLYEPIYYDGLYFSAQEYSNPISLSILGFSPYPNNASLTIVTVQGGSDLLDDVSITIKNSDNYSGEYTIIEIIEQGSTTSFSIESEYVEEEPTEFTKIEYPDGDIYAFGTDIIDSDSQVLALVFFDLDIPSSGALDVRLRIKTANYVYSEREYPSLVYAEEYSASGGWLEDQEVVLDDGHDLGTSIKFTFTSPIDFYISSVSSSTLRPKLLGETGNINSNFSVLDTETGSPFFTIPPSAWIPDPETNQFSTNDFLWLRFVRSQEEASNYNSYGHKVKISLLKTGLSYNPQSYLQYLTVEKTASLIWDFENDWYTPPNGWENGGYKITGYYEWGSGVFGWNSRYIRPADIQVYMWYGGAALESPNLASIVNEIFSDNMPVEYGGWSVTSACNPGLNELSTPFNLAFGTKRYFQFFAQGGKTYYVYIPFDSYYELVDIADNALDSYYIRRTKYELTDVESDATNFLSVKSDYIRDCIESKDYNILIAENPIFITARSDCYYAFNSTVTSSSQLRWGALDSPYQPYFRFKLDIAKDSIINSAKLIGFCRNKLDNNNIKVKISAQLITNAIPITTYSAWETANRTIAFVEWDVPQIGENNVYATPDLAEIIQEIVNQAGWSSGNNIYIFFDDNSSVQYEWVYIDTDNTSLLIDYTGV